MRGKEIPAARQAADQGITPAYAGKSYTQLFLATTARDHPRVCGEKAVSHCSGVGSKGSPPRMRGKGLHRQTTHRRYRITPACAGKSKELRLVLHDQRDHPRVCGEKDLQNAVLGGNLGSPPRVRGKGVQPCNQWVGVGITPACAGKSSPFWCAILPIGGSPPRVRGKAQRRAGSASGSGITPACAGKSMSLKPGLGDA